MADVRKLTDTEAAKLAAFLQRVARPRGAEEERELLHWVKRLEGGRS